MARRLLGVWLLVGTIGAGVAAAGTMVPESFPDRDEIGDDCIADGLECGEAPCCSGECDTTQDVPICAPTEPIPDFFPDEDEVAQCLPLDAICPVDSDTDPCCEGLVCTDGEQATCRPDLNGEE